MQTVDQITAGIVAREGGYVNDPDDPGGATNYGVTIGTLRALGMDLTGDGRITVADVRALTPRIAGEIFQRHYFYGPRIDRLPEALHATVFDMYVNAGSNAVKILQRLVRRLTGRRIAADGLIGPMTLAAVEDAAQRVGAIHLRDLYGVARRDYYYRLGDLRPASRKYARRRDGGKGGWITRAEEFISPSMRLTDAQHRARVARWGR